MIGIIGAMEVEVALLKEKMENPVAVRAGGLDFVTGRLEGQDVVIARCGVGKVFAAMCAQTMIVKFGVTALVNSGVSGTLTDQLHIGDVVVATACVQHDMDTSPLGDPVGLISGINQIELPADPALVAEFDAVCRDSGVHYLKGLIATGDQFIASDEKRRWIVRTFGAISGEMESGSVAQVAVANGVPYAVLRVISDEANGGAPDDFPAFVKRAAKTSSDIVLAWLAKRTAALGA